jgi:copper resistance protein B
VTAALLLFAAATAPGGGLAQHEGHAMPAAQDAPKPADILEWLKPTPPVLPPPPAALSGPAHAADAVFGGEAMARARATLTGEHGDIRVSKVLVDQAEARIGKGRDGYFLNGEAWHGGDIDRLWFKTEIEGDRGRRPDQAELQALWSHAIDPWFQVQTGVRHDFNRGADRTHLAVGVQGLAPYWFELDGALFLSTKGELTARGEAEYDLRLTQRLILQPRLEVNLSAQDIPELGIGSGLVAADLGLRLRYHFDQRFAPYLGIGYERAFGDTRRARRAAGDAGGGVQALVGVRLWF